MIAIKFFRKGEGNTLREITSPIEYAPRIGYQSEVPIVDGGGGFPAIKDSYPHIYTFLNVTDGARPYAVALGGAVFDKGATLIAEGMIIGRELAPAQGADFREKIRLADVEFRGEEHSPWIEFAGAISDLADAAELRVAKAEKECWDTIENAQWAEAASTTRSAAEVNRRYADAMEAAIARRDEEVHGAWLAARRGTIHVLAEYEERRARVAATEGAKRRVAREAALDEYAKAIIDDFRSIESGLTDWLSPE